MEKGERLWIFQTDICRSVYLDYQEEKEFMGFDTLKFVVPAAALKVENEFNLGFCKEIQRGVHGAFSPQVKWDECTKLNGTRASSPENTILDISECKNDKTRYDDSHDCLDGIMDISRCMEGASVTISSPHFYQSDDKFWKMFDGMSDPNDNPSKYETYILIEPYTGAALSLHKRLQFNIPVHRMPDSAYMTKLWEEHALFPMFWIEEFGELDGDYKNKLDDMLTKPLRIVDAVQWTMFAVGVMLLILVVVMFVIYKCKN